MQRISRLLSLPCIVLFVAAVAACERDSGSRAPSEPASAPAPSATDSEPGLPADSAPPPAAAPAPERPEIPPGAALFPTGDPDTSTLMVEHLPGEAHARIGEPYAYGIRITNISTDFAAEHITLRQDLPDAFELLESTPPAEGRRDGVERWRIRRLGPGESVTVRAVGIIDVGDAAPGDVISSTIRLSSAPLLDAAITVAQPRLRVVKSAPESWSASELIPVVYTVTNTGDAPTTPGVLRDAYPEEIVGPMGSPEVALDIPALQPGASHEETVHLRATGPTEIATRAAITTGSGLAAASPRILTVVQQPVLSVGIDGPEVEYAGNALGYTLRVANIGNGPSTDTRIHATVTPAVEVLAPLGADIGEGVLVINIGTLAPGEAKKVAVTLAAPCLTPGAAETGSLTIAAEALAPGARAPGDSPSGSAPASRTTAAMRTTIHGVPPLRVGAAAPLLR